jgi:hypothetical protein
MDRNVVKLGGRMSIGLGLIYLVIGLTYFMVPPAQLKGFSADFWPSLVDSPTWRRIFQFAQALGAAWGVAVVLGVREYSDKKHEAWLGWTSVLAYIGYALGIIDNVRSFQLERLQSVIFMAADPAVKASIVANTAIYNLDSMGVLGFGAVGLWVLVSSHTLAMDGKIPKALGWIGAVTALLMAVVVLGYATMNTAFLSVAAGLGGFIAAPTYFIWLGMSLNRAGDMAEAAPARSKPAKKRR